MTLFVTGAAGFIGSELALRWLGEGHKVVGIDAVTDYYDPALKRARLERLSAHDGFTFVEDRIETPDLLKALMAEHQPTHILHLAAQAGVRYSIDNPGSYMASNIEGTYQLLEAARAHPPKHLLMASTSSVFGANTKMPYAETDRADHPMSFYAATKKATEAMAHSYAHLYDLPTTMFRFFTVYGPWGRPDMAYFKFTKAILEGRPIDVYNHGVMKRDFTYITDLVDAVRRLADAVPTIGQPACAEDSLSPVAPFRVVNIGKSEPDTLADFIASVEAASGSEAQKIMLPMQPGDVPATWSDTTLLKALTGFAATTPLSTGIPAFVDWYRTQYRA